jgi:hypothetical protein
MHVVVCGLLATAFASAASDRPASAAQTVASGGLYVTALPVGSDVWIDGTYVGRSPVLLDALLAGRHSLSIAHTGWLVAEVDVTVPPGGIAMSSTRLLAGPRAFGSNAAAGDVVLRDVPPGAALTLDGAPLDAAVGRPVALAAGEHRLGMTAGKIRSTRPFTVLPDTTTALVLHAERAVAEVRSGVVAPADDYVGSDAYRIDGRRIVVKTSGHVVVARFGETSVRYDGATISYDAAPTMIGGKLCMPLALLEKLSDDMSNAR